MATEFNIRVYEDPAAEYKAADDVYLSLAFTKSKYYTYVLGQITSIVHFPRPSDQGSDYWEIKVTCSVDPDDLLNGHSARLVPQRDKHWIRSVQALQEEIESQRKRFASIEEGYKRAIKTMMEGP